MNLSGRAFQKVSRPQDKIQIDKSHDLSSSGDSDMAFRLRQNLMQELGDPNNISMSVERRESSLSSSNYSNSS